MATPSNTIDHVTLSALVEAGAVRGANVVGQPGGWGIVIQYGMTERALAAKRGSIRIFRHFETLVGYLKGIGVAKYRGRHRVRSGSAQRRAPSSGCVQAHEARP